MKLKFFTTALLALMLSMSSKAETPVEPSAEQLTFRANIINKEYDIQLNINFYDNDITVPGQEVYGPMAGYLVRSGTTFYWFVTSATVNKDGTQAILSLTNDYGSEDLTAQLTCENDSVYTLKQLKGSTLKVPKDGKWQKLPKTLTLKRKK